MNGTVENSFKWNKPDIEIQILHVLSHSWKQKPSAQIQNNVYWNFIMCIEGIMDKGSWNWHQILNASAEILDWMLVTCTRIHVNQEKIN